MKIKDIKNTTKDEISEAIKKVADECRFKEDGSIRESILKGTDTFGTDVKGLIKKVYKDMAKGCKKVMRKQPHKLEPIHKNRSRRIHHITDYLHGS